MTTRPFLLTQTINGETFSLPVSAEVAAIYLTASLLAHGTSPEDAEKEVERFLVVNDPLPYDGSFDDDTRTFALTVIQQPAEHRGLVPTNA